MIKISRLIVLSLFLLAINACQVDTVSIPIPPTQTARILPSATPTEIPVETEPPLYASLRQRMVDEQIAVRDINNQAVLDAMRSVPRHEFVPEEVRELAYADHPLPIGYGQTISQPYIVALMTQSLEPFPGQKVLEIGTGSGYQAAILAQLGLEVYTVEIIPELAERAARTLEANGFSKVHKLNADGYFGWEEFAPFDAILVTAAPDHLPQPLVGQLDEGGRLVIPIGPVGFVQTLWLFEKIEGELEATNLGGVTFVPLTGEHSSP
jgi:protein-L-isoaspartate(D-aspartate) O-methyltransferase